MNGGRSQRVCDFFHLMMHQLTRGQWPYAEVVNGVDLVEGDDLVAWSQALP
jgi:hypothetical protein